MRNVSSVKTSIVTVLGSLESKYPKITITADRCQFHVSNGASNY